MVHVRRHKRETASGRTVTVRAHEREGDDGTVAVPEWSRPARAADLRQEAPAPDDDWWDDEAGDLEPEGPVNWRQQQRDRDPVLASACAACGHDGTPGDPLTLTTGGSRVHRSHTTDPASGFYGEEAAEMSPAFAAMVKQNPSLGGEDFRRLKALRDSGYTGPVDQDGNKVIGDTGITVTPEEPLPGWSPW